MAAGTTTSRGLEDRLTAVATKQAPSTPSSKGALTAPSRARRNTPQRLRLASVVLAVLAAASAVLVAVAVSARSSSVDSARNNSEPVLVDIQTVYTSLSDADTTAAGAFLSGRVPPAALQQRYQSDLAQASAALTSAARQAGHDPKVVGELQTISIDVPVYAGLIQTAQTNNRLGYPVGASYIGEASNLMRAHILPAAADLYQQERARLDGNLQSRSDALVVIAGIVLVATLLGLLLFQVWMSARFRRILNGPLVVATLLIVATGIWMAVALPSQGHHLGNARSSGSTVLGQVTQARILALQARADDELTLVTRDTVPRYQQDYTSVAAQLDSVLAGTAADTDWQAYKSAHNKIRSQDTGGNLTGAIGTASGSGPSDSPAVATRLDDDLQGTIASAQNRFSHETSSAQSDVGGLAIGAAVLCSLAALAVLAGAQQRIGEYR